MRWHGSSTRIRERADDVPGLVVAAELSLGPLPAPPRSAGSAGLSKSFKFTANGTAVAAAASAARLAGGLALEPRPSTHQGRTTFLYNKPSISRVRASSKSRGKSPVRQREAERLKMLARSKLIRQLQARKRQAKFAHGDVPTPSRQKANHMTTGSAQESKGKEVQSLAEKWGFAL